jgi:hypothetical protein
MAAPTTTTLEGVPDSPVQSEGVPGSVTSEGQQEKAERAKAERKRLKNKRK